MARELQETIRCDHPGCRKGVGQSADHVAVSIVHRVAANDVPETVGVAPVAHGEFDFCSWEHALSFLGKRAKEAASDRAELVENAHEAARLQVEQEAEAERAAQEAAEAERAAEQERVAAEEAAEAESEADAEQVA